MMSRGYRLAAVLAGAALAATVSACGGTGQVASGPGVSCANYALHGTGRYHNELSVQATVANSTAHPARYAVDVALTVARSGSASTSAATVTIHGSVPPRTSAELSRKVLTAGAVQRCRIAHVARLGGSR
jgi:hypothetical protein